MGLQQRAIFNQNSYTAQKGDVIKVNDLLGNNSQQGLRHGSNIQHRFGSPDSKSLIGSMNGTLLGNGANVMPDSGAIKSSQRSANFMRAGNSISSSINKTPSNNVGQRNSNNSMRPPRFSHQASQLPGNLLIDNHSDHAM